jgi:hypothetical protein
MKNKHETCRCLIARFNRSFSVRSDSAESRVECNPCCAREFDVSYVASARCATLVSAMSLQHTHLPASLVLSCMKPFWTDAQTVAVSAACVPRVSSCAGCNGEAASRRRWGVAKLLRYALYLGAWTRSLGSYRTPATVAHLQPTTKFAQPCLTALLGTLSSTCAVFLVNGKRR